MARITLGLGTSHGPMLSVPWESWHERVPADRTNPQHFYQGKTYTFDEIAAARSHEPLTEQLSPEVMASRHARCQAAIHELGDLFEAEKPDGLILIGNDQMEIFTPDHLPAFAVFWGPYAEGIPRSQEFLDRLPPGVARAELDRTPKEYTQYPGMPAFGRHLIESAMGENFDVAQITKLPAGSIGSNAAPHAYGFVYRRILRDKLVPHVPVFVNTFYPPNQPSAARCFTFGQALARAAASWGEDLKLAVIASGGMTHFVIDEAFDLEVLEAIRTADVAKLASIPPEYFQSGTSEIKNWIVMAGVMAEAGLPMRMIDYVPCYRSRAGTGSAMGFAHWGFGVV